MGQNIKQQKFTIFQSTKNMMFLYCLAHWGTFGSGIICLIVEKWEFRAGIELANFARVPSRSFSNFQDPIFQVLLTDFPIFQVKFKKFPCSKKGLVVSHFLDFQFFKCSNHKVTQGPSNGTCQKISNFSSFAHRFSNFSSQIQNSSLLKKGTSGQPHFGFPIFQVLQP